MLHYVAGVLQVCCRRVAARCSMLYRCALSRTYSRVPVCCSVWQCVVVCHSKLQLHIFNPKIPVDAEYHKVAVCCSVLQGVPVCCSVLQCAPVNAE